MTHAEFIRSLPCLICLKQGEFNDVQTEWCHIKYADASLAKPAASNQKRTDDYWTVPMCGPHHRLQHSGSERKFWLDAGINPLHVSLRLWSVSGSYQSGLAVLKAAAQFTSI